MPRWVSSCTLAGTFLSEFTCSACHLSQSIFSMCCSQLETHAGWSTTGQPAGCLHHCFTGSKRGCNCHRQSILGSNWHQVRASTLLLLPLGAHVALTTPTVHVLPGHGAPAAQLCWRTDLQEHAPAYLSISAAIVSWLRVIDQSGGLKPYSLQGHCGSAFNAG